MLSKSITNYKKVLSTLQTQNHDTESLIANEDSLYLESKQKLEQIIAKEVVVDFEINLLTYSPDVSKIKDEDIQDIIQHL
jgi:predicted Zn-dependent peptidase